MEYVITISQLRSALDKHLGDDKRIFIGEHDSTSIREMDSSTLVTVIIDDAVAAIRESKSSSPGEAKQEPSGEVAPKTYTMPEGYSVDQGGAAYGEGGPYGIPVTPEEELGTPGSGTTNMGYW